MDPSAPGPARLGPVAGRGRGERQAVNAMAAPADPGSPGDRAARSGAGDDRAGGGRLGWYVRRLRRMSPEEVGWRLEDRLREAVWAHRRFVVAPPPGCRPPEDRPRPPVPVVDLVGLAPHVRRAVVDAAEELCHGRGVVLGIRRDDLADPDWWLDPVSGERFPADRSAFRVDYRGPDDRRQVKQVWELSRHHHLTVLASAWRLTGDERYAAMVADQLTSWWGGNRVCTGVNWASGIELGIRLISWVWTRRLLEGWAPAPYLFEQNPVALHHVYWHQRFLSSFRSRGSSANNHVIAEAAGLFVAACGFPWFAESERWRVAAAELLQRELRTNTFPSGVNREQAFEYHGLVTELALVAAAEGEAAGAPLEASTWHLTTRMLDAAAAVLDRAGRPPRSGDGDDGRALVVDDPSADRWRSLLAAGTALVGAQRWWPEAPADVRSTMLGGLADLGGPAVRRMAAERPARRPSHFADAGLTLLRSPAGSREEIWCRCDGGPHGFLSIAAHAHADALSVEVRVDGVELLVDPGTYCYQGDPEWRRYFRSTRAHNTLELDHRDQSVAGGPFLWTRQARTTLLDVVADDVDVDTPLRWSAEHDGYRRLDPPAAHRRTVTLDRARHSLRIEDRVTTEDPDRPHFVRLVFHLAPAVDVALRGWRASLRWRRPGGGTTSATLLLPLELGWTAHRGELDPPLGWYSPRFARKEPITTLVGAGRLATCRLLSELRLGPARPDGSAGLSAPDGAGPDGSVGR